MKPDRRSRNVGSVRIIGGSLRSRRIRFDGGPALRPTPDRVRETLFNWLRGKIGGCRCLDLFAGSGALGFEAASRGADAVTLVERDPRAARGLAENMRLLGCTNVKVECGEALAYLEHCDQAWDVVFLDPPFSGDALPRALELLRQRQLLRPDALVYAERSDRDAGTGFGNDWEILREGRYGDVRFALLHSTAS